MSAPVWRNVRRGLALVLLCGICLQAVFAARIALMAVVAPQSTPFQRSEAWRLLRTEGRIDWRQEWVDMPQISRHLQRAVIASEDAGFVEHSGVEWDAIEKAWERNQKAQDRVAKINEQREKQAAKVAAKKPDAPAATPKLVVPKVIGGSTITQQLAKNLFLSSERNLLRKGQEFVITFMLEALLSKQRILEIYLNNVEWGEGVFGAEAAAQHYFRSSAAQLAPGAAARLAVMLPAPKRFEKNPRSAYVSGRAGTVGARMGGVELP
jgi:monofunctional biosynthetic peptidoglycan transglycosylase